MVIGKPVESPPPQQPEANLDGSAGTMVLDKGLERGMKRKRGNDNETLAAECRRELDALIQLYEEVSGCKGRLEDNSSASEDSVVASLLEGSNLPLSKLVKEIYEALKGREGVTMSFVRSAVMSVGERVMYGVVNPNTGDILEDDSESSMWCWEAKYMDLLPIMERGNLNIRRIVRRRIHQRVSALSEMLSVLSVPESRESCKNDLTKASVKLGEVLDEEGIRSLIEKSNGNNGFDIAVKETKLKGKTEEVDTGKSTTKKENKRIARENQKDKCQSGKESKQLKEAEKEERHCAKEAVELNKQLKKRQETERDQRRQKKEEAEVKKQRATERQPTIMQLFLKSKKKNNNPDKPEQGSSSNGPMSDSSCKNEDVVSVTTTSMDCAFSKQEVLAIEDLQKSQVTRWHKLCHWNRSYSWGVRRNPKIELIKELKLRKLSCEAEPREDTTSSTGPTNYQSSKRKLLQFNENCRPAYYGTWCKKTGEVMPRNPFKKDPYLDYGVDSGAEWEEEDLGESLSDCHKDNEDSSDEEDLKAEGEDDNEDSFIIADGSLSENEGIQVDGSSEGKGDEAISSSNCNSQIESEEFKARLRQQKHLNNSTEQALRKQQPLFISNLMHEKAEMAMSEDLMCLQALSMQACPGGSVIDVSTNNYLSNKNQEVCESPNRNGNTSTTTVASMPDSDLSEFVRFIQSNSTGIEKVVESIQGKFPSYKKSRLRKITREISDFVDNQWQVKKEILSRLGFSNSPGKYGRPKGIEKYFSKRTLPPECESSKTLGSSPRPCSKIEAHPDVPAEILDSSPQTSSNKTERHPGENGHSPHADV